MGSRPRARSFPAVPAFLDTSTSLYVVRYVLEEGTDAEVCLRNAHSLIFHDDLEAGVCPAYLDGRVFVLYDETPALVYGPVCERIHGFDERVNLESVRRITKTVALFMADWCDVEAVS